MYATVTRGHCADGAFNKLSTRGAKVLATLLTFLHRHVHTFANARPIGDGDSF